MDPSALLALRKDASCSTHDTYSPTKEGPTLKGIEEEDMEKTIETLAATPLGRARNGTRKRLQDALAHEESHEGGQGIHVPSSHDEEPRINETKENVSEWKMESAAGSPQMGRVPNDTRSGRLNSTEPQEQVERGSMPGDLYFL